MADGIVLQECLEMGGFPLRDKAPLQDVPDRLWRTLVAGRDSQGQPAPLYWRVAFVNLADQIEKFRSIDTKELLENSDSYMIYAREFLKRIQEVIWNRRVFKASSILYSMRQSNYQPSPDEELFGLAPQRAIVGDKICLLYGCSVPVLLGEVNGSRGDVRGDQFEIIGEAYVDKFMDGEAFGGEFGQILESKARDFTLR